MKRKNIGRVAGAAATSLAVGLTMAQSAVAAAPDLPPVCTGGTLSKSNTTAAAIPDNNTTGVSRTINVTGATGTVRDVDTITNITHQSNGDLEISLTHGLKTVRFLSSVPPNRAGKNGFDGTRWDDSALAVVSEADLQSDGPKTALVPEGAMAAFIGDDPNGDWTLRVKDLDPLSTGTLNSWRLDLATAATAAPGAPLVTVAGAGGTVATVPGTGVLEKKVTVSGASPYLTDLDLVTTLAHGADPAEMRVSLTSPQGTTVVISKGRGSGSLEALSTTWNDTAPVLVTATNDLWAPGQTRPSMVPEGALGAFIGQNPNGEWTLTVADNVALDGFTLNGWSLKIGSTNGCAPPPPPPPPDPTPVTQPVVISTPPGPTCVRVGFVVKVLGDKKALRGSLAVVRVKVRNSTLGAGAGNAKAKFTIPAGFTLAVTPKGATVKGRTVTLNLGAIAGDKSKTVAIKLKARASAGLGLKKSAISVTAACGSTGSGKLAVTVGRARA
jgi:subtilisin-like proprotein convertase family protein